MQLQAKLIDGACQRDYMSTPSDSSQAQADCRLGHGEASCWTLAGLAVMISTCVTATRKPSIALVLQRVGKHGVSADEHLCRPSRHPAISCAEPGTDVTSPPRDRDEGAADIRAEHSC